MPTYSRVFEAHGQAEEMAAFAAVLWKERMADLKARKLVTSGRVRIVDRYVRALTEYEFLYPQAMAEGPTLQAESGGQFANMRWHAVGKLNEQIMKFEAALAIPAKHDEGDAPAPPRPKSKASRYLD
ncbi:P27 family phage terminase small subunit [Falsirhodobacter halotolerans]|uniref:P27 family phage terminase small subunit n=1 Tax=Falsirhodobacter halotolerans TaxID=1146892 RepID=UPI001FD24F3F|nr:hypothetical protein [Falsirhodobacter halotolerans]MCJ8138595.1 hypothetical protein [Falsirhodobacter halotolerans]